jgi:2-(1,2-epoxy-1,2-dihydrophenyl)acetyl-CoA isomerase
VGIVNYELADGIATITLNRPDSLNSLTDDVMIQLSESFARVDEDESVRVVVLTGAGRGFCSGADLAAVNSGEAGRADGDSMADIFNPAMRALAECRVPTIGRINGVAAGGGFGLAMTCDISIAARSAFFVSTFGPRLGLVPDLGTSWHLPLRVGAARARGIAMLGGRITAEQASEWGLIWDVVDDDALDAAVDEVAQLLKRSSPGATTRTRAVMTQAPHNSFSEHLDLEHQHQIVLIPANMLDGARAFIEKCDPVFSPDRWPDREVESSEESARTSGTLSD